MNSPAAARVGEFIALTTHLFSPWEIFANQLGSSVESVLPGVCVWKPGLTLSSATYKGRVRIEMGE